MSSIKINRLNFVLHTLKLLTTKILTITIDVQSHEFWISLRYDPCVSLRVMPLG